MSSFLVARARALRDVDAGASAAIRDHGDGGDPGWRRPRFSRRVRRRSGMAAGSLSAARARCSLAGWRTSESSGG